jgi:hypothetical protein
MAEDTNPFSSFGSALGGLLGFGQQAAPAAGGPTDPYDMLSEAEKRRLMLGTLGQVGATLLAAGQKQMPAQRAQLLAQLGNAVPNVEQAAFRSQQARLMNAQTQEKMREIEQNKALSEWAKNPENLGKIGMTPEQFSVLGIPGVRSVIQAQASRDPIQQAAAAAALAKAREDAAARQQAMTMIEQSNMSDEEKAAARLNWSEWSKSRLRPEEQWVTEAQKDANGQPIINPNTNMPLMIQRNTRTGEIKGIGGGGVTITQPPAETEEQKVIGKALGEAQAELRTAASRAPDNIAKLNLLADLTQGVKTGALAPARSYLIANARALGVSDEAIRKIGEDPNLPATGQAIEKIVNELTIGLIGPGGFPANSFSNADRDFLEKIWPSIKNEPGANFIAIEVAKRGELRKAQKQAEWRAYSEEQRAAGKKPSFADFEDAYVAKLNRQEKEGGESLFAGLAERARPFSEQGGPKRIKWEDMQ